MATEDEDLADDLIEVYRCSMEMEANRAIVEVLNPASLLPFRRDRSSHALPAPAAETGGYFIAVPAHEADEARQLLRQALKDGVLDDEDGQVIEAAEP